MSNLALYDVQSAYKKIHEIILDLAESLDDEQLSWKPANYGTSIGFYLWHLGREADFLKAAVLEHFPQIGPDFGEAKQIWHAENLAMKWGFPATLGETEVGTGISDEVAANLPIPPKDQLLDYLRRSYQAIDEFIDLLDTRYPNFDQVENGLRTAIERIRLNLLVFMMHDGRHLGMMECLKGLLTGFGSATEKRG